MLTITIEGAALVVTMAHPPVNAIAETPEAMEHPTAFIARRGGANR